uniref:Uncharacterized protein n=1 Tax=Amphimedon queenslandica TaxID=400682 RepID=A0A1X7UWM6_AMPQE
MSFEWNGKQVASLAKSGGTIYILANEEIPVLHHEVISLDDDSRSPSPHSLPPPILSIDSVPYPQHSDVAAVEEIEADNHSRNSPIDDSLSMDTTKMNMISPSRSSLAGSDSPLDNLGKLLLVFEGNVTREQVCAI